MTEMLMTDPDVEIARTIRTAARELSNHLAEAMQFLERAERDCQVLGQYNAAEYVSGDIPPLGDLLAYVRSARRKVRMTQAMQSNVARRTYAND